MKVTFFLAHFPLPSQTFVLNQITALIDIGHDVEILSIWPGNFKNKHEKFIKYNLKEKTHYLNPQETRSKNSKTINRIKNIGKSFYRSDVRKAMNVRKYGMHAKNLLLPSVIALNPRPFISDVFIAHFGTEGVFALKLRQLGVISGPICTIFHGSDISHKDTVKKYLNDYQKLFAETELILPISKLWKSRLEEMGCPAEKISVSHMGVNIDDFAFEPRLINKDSINIISVARLNEKKGLVVAIKACALLKKFNIKFRYIIIGDGPLKGQLTSLISKLQLENEVELSGFKTQDSVKVLLAKADIFLLPSVTGTDGDMEGIPVALMEAMACGLPVVSTFHSGIPELVENSVSGWLAPEFDDVKLAEIIESIIQGTTDVHSVLLNARKKIEDEFNEMTLNKNLSEKLKLKFTS
ncbi:glycosyltransferase [Acerihabitans arboris]|uniref:Colanic acid biosynthesis glycosyltransferase WcaL n=1 Tax=Acerihabitans arboris TaxID=2691583 RepID=A0A845SBW6_9GAMM|nr:glycosyltransferase [Acerihabitans arboris]NDL62333.1 colanic acid biosynthesis glycosyltransferase WcaL [Acerihabitans arboris]